ncbi:MAG: DUF6288 domain-containing protein [bacterium]
MRIRHMSFLHIASGAFFLSALFPHCGSAAEAGLLSLTGFGPYFKLDGSSEQIWKRVFIGPSGAVGSIAGREIIVREIAPGSPADGILKVDDVILSADGHELGDDPRIGFGYAVGDVQARDGKLKMDVYRDGAFIQVAVALSVYGPTPADWPLEGGEKSKVIHRQFCDYIVRNLARENIPSEMRPFPSCSGLILLAHPDPKYLEAARRLAYIYVRNPSKMEGMGSLDCGYTAIYLAEYYMVTGDRSVLPELERVCGEIVKGQAPCGSWSHGAWHHGAETYAIGGIVNPCGMACMTGLIMARNAGVPHDWSIEGDYSETNTAGVLCGYLPSGIGWYRREIQIPESWQGRSVSVAFDGVYMNSEVWLNGEHVGGRPYGYLGFTCDLTAQLKPGRNVLSVRVDNALEPSARWYHGCGIYGHVRLTATDPVHVPASCVFVQTPVVTPAAATVRAAVELKNASQAAAAVEVHMEILGASNETLAAGTVKTAVPAGGASSITHDLDLKQPALWSVETPVLYTLKTQLLRAGVVVDEVATPFGVRTLKFDAETGFYLNGRSVKLKGVCEHQGCSPVGAAMPEALMERRMQQLKAMGCNAIRVSHNPQLPYFYDLCDRLGVLVMDEIFDGWHEKADYDYGARFFKAEWKKDVTDWVRRDRNHPCVIFWSVGNETGKTDEHQITELIHTLDLSRPTTGGAVIEGVDVAGFNGGIVEKDSVLLDFHRDNPRVQLRRDRPRGFSERSLLLLPEHLDRGADGASVAALDASGARRKNHSCGGLRQRGGGRAVPGRHIAGAQAAHGPVRVRLAGAVPARRTEGGGVPRREGRGRDRAAHCRSAVKASGHHGQRRAQGRVRRSGSGNNGGNGQSRHTCARCRQPHRTGAARPGALSGQ